MHDAVQALCKNLAVRDDDHSQAVRFMEGAKEAVDLIGCAAVQVPRRFVGKQKPGRHDESARNGNTLLLSAGEFSGLMGEAVAETDFSENRSGPVGGLGSGGAGDESGHHDIFKGREFGQKLVELENESDGAIAERIESAAAQSEDIAPLEQHPPAGGTVQAAEDVHEGRLSGA